jgi:hypothetical protein
MAIIRISWNGEDEVVITSLTKDGIQDTVLKKAPTDGACSESAKNA